MSQDSSEFDEEIQKMVDETPKLDVACKNLMALLGAKSMPTEEPVPLSELLSCAKVLLKQLNAHELVDVVEWGVKHPQGELTALQRIDQLRQYKVLYALRARVAEMGGKVSKLFGRLFLQWSGCWKEVRAACEAPENAPKDVPDEVLALFLDSFELALCLPDAEKSGRIQVVEPPSDASDLGIRSDRQTADTKGIFEALNTAISSSTEHVPMPLPLHPPLKASEEDKDLIFAPSFTEALAMRRRLREEKVQVAKDWEGSQARSASAGTGRED